MALSTPSSASPNQMQYANLKGADFSKDMTEVDRYHSPDTVNMISDEGGNPVKRIGWRKVIDGTDVIDFLLREEKGVQYMYVLSKTALTKYTYPFTGTGEAKIQAPTGGFESGNFVQYSGDVLLFTLCNDIPYLYRIQADGSVVTLKKGTEDDTHELENIRIPLVTYGRNTDGTGGTSYYDTNLLTRYRKISFAAEKTTTSIKLYPKDTWAGFFKYIVKGSVAVRITTETGQIDLPADKWSYKTATTVTGFNENGQVASFTVTDPEITVDLSSYALVSAPNDNVEIRFKPFVDTDYKLGETTSKLGTYYPKMQDVMRPRASAVFGYKAMDRLFVAGGKELNTVYFSDVNDPTYFPDLNYITIGQSTNGIVGFHRISSYLMALKDDGSEESTAFIIQGFVYDEGGTEERTTFGVLPMTSGVGAVASRSFATLGDEPLFLSRTGVYGVASTYTATEKMVQNRSAFVNKRLLAEPNLKNAAACTWNNYYVLCINGHGYVMDGRQQSTDPNKNSTYLYETYYWDNVPAVKLQAHHGDLWFMDNNSNICRFNTDINHRSKYSDDGVVENARIERGRAIKCRYATKLDDCYRPHYLKTMQKRGALITIAPHERTSVTVTLVKDGIDSYALEPYYFDISDWNNVDYSTFSIETSNIAKDAFVRKKLKKYKRIQLVIENNEVNEPFGLINIIFSYTVGNLAKK